MKHSLLAITFFIFAGTLSAQAPEGAQPLPVETPAITAEAAPLTQENALELNIIYLVPSDKEPLDAYKRRLGEILFTIEYFYNTELERNGSAARLRMPKDPETGLVALEEVKGAHTLAEYPYAEGWKTAIPDVEKYLAEHPRATRSDRTLIIIPTTDNPPNVPFYGFGKMCFALDYEGFDIRHCGLAGTPEGEKFRPWFGGLAHELGHGLGLPHTHATVSQEKAFGTALMSHGNRTLGFQPTFLTPTDCAFLESCPASRAFTPRPLVKAEGRFKPTVEWTGEAPHIKGQIPQDSSVRSLVAAFDKDDFGHVNNNYDAESFVVPFDAQGNFAFTFPMEEIHPGKGEKVQIQLYLIHDDGTSELYRYTRDVPKKAPALPPERTT